MSYRLKCNIADFTINILNSLWVNDINKSHCNNFDNSRVEMISMYGQVGWNLKQIKHVLWIDYY